MTRRNRSHQSMRRRRQTSARLGWLVGGAFVTVLTVSFVFDDMGVRKYVGMLRHARELEQDIRELERTNEELRVEVRRVQHDPSRIEELARERLGYVRKGETVFQPVPDPSAAPPRK